MNPDYLAGMRAFSRGEPFDPKQRGQWRRGWERACENALDKWATANPDIVKYLLDLGQWPL